MAITRSAHLAEDFAEDPRYRVAHREFWISVAYFVAYASATLGIAWTLGGNKPASELNYVFGFPDWYFWGGLVVSLAFSIIPFFVVKFLFTDMPLTTDGSLPPDVPGPPAGGEDDEGNEPA